MKRKTLLILLLILPIMLLAACSRNSSEPEEPPPDVNVHVRETPESDAPSPADLLSVHFIDVGEGDAILIVQGDYAMLIDGGPVEIFYAASQFNLYSYNPCKRESGYRWATRSIL